MEVAIQLEKIDLGNDKVLFKPIRLIKGHYDESSEVFLDELNNEFQQMENYSIGWNNYFCCATTLDDLKEIYTSDILSDDDILDIFFEEYEEIFYIGNYDYNDCYTKVIEIDFKNMDKYLSDLGDIDLDKIQYYPEENEKFVFSLNALRELRDYQTVEEIREYIDKLIKASEYIKEIESENTYKSNINLQTSTEEKPKKTIKLDKDSSKNFSLKGMRDFVLSEIVAQDEAVKRITTCIMSNFDSTDYRRKKHLLLTGPTGTGKSKTIQLICEYLNIPYAKVDSTDYTQAGYVGRSVDEMLQRLIYAADGDIEKAQNGILVIDEIDKKAKKGESSGEVATKAVMDSLLKITGRGVVQVDIIEDKTKTTIDFDTSNLTVIFTGAFEGIDELDSQEVHKSIGFMSTQENKPQEAKNIHKMLIKYGMTPELIGRIKCIVPLKSFEEKDYVQILKYSKGSPLVIEKDYYENDKGIKFTYTSNFIKELAKQAMELNVGARGLESVVSKSLEDVQERVLNREKIKVLKLTKKTAINNKEYCVEY